MRYISALLLIIFAFTFQSCQKASLPTNPDDPGGGGGGTGDGIATINGKVYDRDGFPLQGIKAIAQDSIIAYSGVFGDFQLPNVTYPYNLKLISYSDSATTIYQQLRNVTPLLTFNNTPGAPVNNVGKIAVNYPDLGPDQYAFIGFSTSDNAYVLSSPGLNVDSMYIKWYSGTPIINGKVVYMNYMTKSAGVTPDMYQNYAEKPVTDLSPGNTKVVTFTVDDLTFVPTTSSITVTNTSSAVDKHVDISIPFFDYKNSELKLGSISDYTSPTFSFKVPSNIPVNRFKLLSYSRLGYDSYSERVSFNFPNEFVTFGNETSVGQTAPIDGAANVNRLTAFTYFAGAEHGVYEVHFFTPSSPNGGVTFFTTDTFVKIPDLRGVGKSFLPNTRYFWTVTKYFTFNTIDEFTNFTTSTFKNSYTKVYSRNGRAFQTSASLYN